MPHFFIDDQFSDSKEVLAIPQRYRLAAVGLFTLMGSWSANKLLDGFVSDEKIKQLGGRPVLIAALAGIRGPNGEDWALIVIVSGGIRITNWAKWQRTREQVVAYRARQAEKKRKQRERIENTESSSNPNMSPRDTSGDSETCPQGTPQTPIPIPKPVPKRSTYVSSDLALVDAPDAEIEPIAATPAADLVRAVIPSEHPPAVQTALRLRAGELLHAGTEPATVTAALKLWLTKPNLGPNTLASLVSEVIKTRDGPTVNGVGKPTQKALGYAAAAERIIAAKRTTT